jgi:hypothetical protein
MPSVAPWYDRGHTLRMKVTVSIPDAVFNEADGAAKRLRIARSDLYARALIEYLAKLRGDEVTKQLDTVYANRRPAIDPVLAAMQLRSIDREEW